MVLSLDNRPGHLLTVWNPSYAEDALDAHLRVFLRWAERSRDPADDASPEEDVYIWWAKIRSPRRAGELPHAAEIAAIQSQIDDERGTSHDVMTVVDGDPAGEGRVPRRP